jgi:hypothetical protein
MVSKSLALSVHASPHPGPSLMEMAQTVARELVFVTEV